MNKKQTIYVLAIILVILQLFFNKTNPLPKISLISPTNSPVPSPTTIITPSEKQLVKVIRVIDGDTIEIEGKIKVRYIGINTPELHDPRRPVQCYGQTAADENKRLVEGKEVYIQKDVSEVDKYKRLLRYVWVGDIFINDYLVRQGFAQVSTFPPDIKYQQQFLEAQLEAKKNNRGLWKECRVSN